VRRHGTIRRGTNTQELWSLHSFPLVLRADNGISCTSAENSQAVLTEKHGMRRYGISPVVGRPHSRYPSRGALLAEHQVPTDYGKYRLGEEKGRAAGGGRWGATTQYPALFWTACAQGDGNVEVPAGSGHALRSRVALRAQGSIVWGRTLGGINAEVTESDL